MKFLKTQYMRLFVVLSFIFAHPAQAMYRGPHDDGLARRTGVSNALVPPPLFLDLAARSDDSEEDDAAYASDSTASSDTPRWHDYSASSSSASTDDEEEESPLYSKVFHLPAPPPLAPAALTPVVPRPLTSPLIPQALVVPEEELRPTPVFHPYWGDQRLVFDVGGGPQRHGARLNTWDLHARTLRGLVDQGRRLANRDATNHAAASLEIVFETADGTLEVWPYIFSHGAHPIDFISCNTGVTQKIDLQNRPRNPRDPVLLVSKNLLDSILGAAPEADDASDDDDDDAASTSSTSTVTSCIGGSGSSAILENHSERWALRFFQVRWPEILRALIQAKNPARIHGMVFNICSLNDCCHTCRRMLKEHLPLLRETILGNLHRARRAPPRPGSFFLLPIVSSLQFFRKHDDAETRLAPSSMVIERGLGNPTTALFQYLESWPEYGRLWRQTIRDREMRRGPPPHTLEGVHASGMFPYFWIPYHRAEVPPPRNPIAHLTASYGNKILRPLILDLSREVMGARAFDTRDVLPYLPGFLATQAAHLTHLDLSGTRLELSRRKTPQTLDPLLLRGLRSLTFLNLSHTDIRSFLPEILETLPRLEKLFLSHAVRNYRDFDLRTNRPLATRLELFRAMRQPVNLEARGAPPYLGALRFLDLSGNEMNADELASLLGPTPGATFRGLQALDLSHNPLGDPMPVPRIPDEEEEGVVFERTAPQTLSAFLAARLRPLQTPTQPQPFRLYLGDTALRTGEFAGAFVDRFIRLQGSLSDDLGLNLQGAW